MSIQKNKFTLNNVINAEIVDDKMDIELLLADIKKDTANREVIISAIKSVNKKPI